MPNLYPTFEPNDIRHEFYCCQCAKKIKDIGLEDVMGDIGFKHVTIRCHGEVAKAVEHANCLTGNGKTKLFRQKNRYYR